MLSRCQFKGRFRISCAAGIFYSIPLRSCGEALGRCPFEGIRRDPSKIKPALHRGWLGSSPSQGSIQVFTSVVWAHGPLRAFVGNVAENFAETLVCLGGQPSTFLCNEGGCTKLI